MGYNAPTMQLLHARKSGLFCRRGYAFALGDDVKYTWSWHFLLPFEHYLW